MEWPSESRWRAHVIRAARCVMLAHGGAVQGQAPRPSIEARWEAALENRGAAGSSIRPAGRVAAFGAP
jgi:hypothetical protein